jgi:hypothetical protein
MNNELSPPAIIQTYEAITPLVKRRIAQVKGVKSDLRLKREMLRDALQAHSDYLLADQVLKESQKALKRAKAAVASRDVVVRKIELDIKQLVKDKKEQQLSLFSSLDTYRLTTGSNYIEDDDGTEYKINTKHSIAKIPRKKARR